MAQTTFSGPVVSENGFSGQVVGNVVGNVTGNVTGYIILPTSNPGVAGALWNNAGTIAISAG